MVIKATASGLTLNLLRQYNNMHFQYTPNPTIIPQTNKWSIVRPTNEKNRNKGGRKKGRTMIWIRYSWLELIERVEWQGKKKKEEKRNTYTVGYIIKLKVKRKPEEQIRSLLSKQSWETHSQ